MEGTVETPESMAAAIAAGRTVMWCDWPALDGTATAGDHLHVLGWAYCAGGIEEIAVIARERRFEPRTGLPRPDVDRSLPGFEGRASGFALVIDTRAWPEGPHTITVEATGRGGPTIARTGVVQVGSDLPYRAWLRRRAADRTVPAPVEAPPPLAVHVLIGTGARGALEASLANQIQSNWRRAEGTLADTLKAVARDGGAAVLVEDRGALAPAALARLTAALAREPAPDVVYGDEDAVMADGQRGDAFLKPGWSPELLLSMDYIGPLVAIGPRAAGAALAADEHPPETIYEVLLRIVDAPLRVERIAEVLFTSDEPRVPADEPRTRDAIQRLAARRGRRAQVVPLECPGTRDVRWELGREPLVSVVIPTNLSGGRLSACLRALESRTTYSNLELVLVDSSADGLESVNGLVQGHSHRVVRFRGAFNFSTAINLGARAASGDYLLLLNDDTEARTPDWVQRMVEQLLAPGAGVVGCKLLYPNGTVQHAGVVLDVEGSGSWHVHWGFAADAPGYRGMLQTTRNYSAVTGACMMVSTELFAELGGFDEGFEAEFSDVDLCLRAIERGRRVVWTPHAVVAHHERSSFPMRVNRSDFDRFVERWSSRYSGGDPLYHPAFLAMSYEFPPPPGGTPAADTVLPMQAPDAPGEFEPPPPTFEGLAEAISHGRTAMWCEAPPLDGDARAVGYLDVRGWAYSRAGIDGVFVYLDGLRYQARPGALRPDLGALFTDDDLSRSGFELSIELGEQQAGQLELAVVAHGADGHVVGMRGQVECRPGAAVSAEAAAAIDAHGNAAEAAAERTLELMRAAEQGRLDAERRLAALERSLSWRITRPLRRLKQVLRR
jgi:GT2 family glycosyltransferase